MVRCTKCPNFQKEISWCEWYKALISKGVWTKDIQCEGHPRTKIHREYMKNIQEQRKNKIP